MADGATGQATYRRTDHVASLLATYQRVRQFTEELCQPLAIEDYVIQAIPDVSPTKWHLAHTSWFFETFILSQAMADYQSLNDQYTFLFNSYYVAAGDRYSRPDRGLLSRPTVDEIYQYRAYVDRHMTDFLASLEETGFARWGPLVDVGLNHEQQHQELMLTDLKYNLSINPLRPAYHKRIDDSPGDRTVPALEWVHVSEGVYAIGHEGEGFIFDNEAPRHRVFVEPFALASRLVTNGEYMAFIADGGYERPEWWLSMGWDTAQREQWQTPLYWEKRDDSWWAMTLAGMQPVDDAEPVSHVSYYEADAYARWADARLATEAEWEIAAAELPIAGNFADQRRFHPAPLRQRDTAEPLAQMFGDVWEWTQSHYSPYPGYTTPPGALGEYNGKFMANQFVLRGGSCATSASHIRPTYRNFFPADARWQFMGIRLAKTTRG